MIEYEVGLKWAEMAIFVPIWLLLLVQAFLLIKMGVKSEICS